MLSRVSDNPQNCQITDIQIISNRLNHEPSCQTVGCNLVKRGPIASEIAVLGHRDFLPEKGVGWCRFVTSRVTRDPSPSRHRRQLMFDLAPTCWKGV
jgi:hypothetical protein